MSEPDEQSSSGPTRRTVLAAVGLAGVGAAALAGCSGADEGSGAGAGGGAEGGAIEASSVPVGGGTIVASQRVVVTQPSAGEFKAFSAICPHEGCIVSAVSGGTISCGSPCGHGSSFDAATGAVKTGPATRALTALTVTAKGGTLTVS